MHSYIIITSMDSKLHDTPESCVVEEKKKEENINEIHVQTYVVTLASYIEYSERS